MVVFHFSQSTFGNLFSKAVGWSALAQESISSGSYAAVRSAVANNSWLGLINLTPAKHGDKPLWLQTPEARELDHTQWAF